MNGWLEEMGPFKDVLRGDGELSNIYTYLPTYPLSPSPPKYTHKHIYMYNLLS